MLRYLPVVLLMLASCATWRAPAPETWEATQHREHPLVGRIYDVRSGTFVEREVLDEAVARADFVLLGEVHDHPDHHRLQASLTRAAARGGHTPPVAFEMIDLALQPAVDAAGAEPDAIAAAVNWDRSGWPAFAIYRPIFVAAQESGLRVIAANLSRATARAVVMEGVSALDPALRTDVEAHWPPAPELLAASHAEMRVSHCGHFPEAMLEPMVLAQLARDAQLARGLVEASSGGRGILIAGNGHVRRSGVPALLEQMVPARKVVTVGMLEVEEQETAADAAVKVADPASEGRGPAFDFVLFTPAQEREDPCAAMKVRGD